ncbi:hypothetical protein PMAA_023040 [Talaromyces marneffei ATCC 18224]|uniref:Uncharacterized protein n=1 Tax=Talaromyces marneffei (strain ATCC 18224 / CBS 334.59 / QM 7333) TaxID=441960 RepID=B6Q5F3_TALMQ|nr:hypothetical protein PMAA_023040 [Talaromyces marneffei ATCC 18224]
MPSRQRYMSYSSSALPTLTVTNGHVELSYQPTKSRPHSQYISALDFDKNAYYMDDCASVGSSLSDDMADEHEIFVNLNSRAMAAIPMRLQNIMCEIQQERYDRLRQENPNLRVMPADYWIKPVEPVRKKPVRYNRAPTPLRRIMQLEDIPRFRASDLGTATDGPHIQGWSIMPRVQPQHIVVLQLEVLNYFMNERLRQENSESLMVTVSLCHRI